MADRLPAQGTMLLGRGSECQVFDRLLHAARGGRSGTLVVRGEAGVGKTALLQYAIASASDLRIVRADVVESEMELPFAALHQLCGPLLDGLERLPAPQADASAPATSSTARSRENRAQPWPSDGRVRASRVGASPRRRARRHADRWSAGGLLYLSVDDELPRFYAGGDPVLPPASLTTSARS